MSERQPAGQNDEAVLSRLKRGFEDWLNATNDSREEAESARDYYDGKQWTDEERATLAKRPQPVITDNLLKDKIEYVIGMELSTRTDPKAYPRNPADQDAAEAATDALRYIGDASDFSQVKSDVAENIFIEGMGGAEVYARGQDIVIRRNRWERCYWDPHSSEKDYSDASYRGTFVWMDVEDAEALFPGAGFWDVVSADTTTTGQDSDSDRPRENSAYIDRARKRVRILETYSRVRGVWMCARWTYAGLLKPEQPSRWLDESGQPEHPYCWMSAYVDRENNRYGLVRRYRDLQDEVNHRRSRALHLLNTRQVVTEDGAVDDVEDLRREVAKADGVIVKRPNMELEINANTDLSAGQMALLQDARQALAVTGPKAIQNTSTSQSGRAKEIERQTDVLELGRLFDQLRHFQKQCYRKAWNRVRQTWTAEKWVRVTDDESKVRFVALNQPVSAAEVATEQMKRYGAVDPMIAGLPPQMVVSTRNATADLVVDIMIDDMPDVVTLQQEQFANLVDLARAGVVFPPEVYVEASALRNKAAILEKLKGGEQDPAVAAAAQQQAALAERAATAKIAESETKAAKNAAEAEQTKIENMAGLAGLAGMATNAGPLQ